MTCTKYGCDYELDLDGQVTCTVCGAMDDDIQPVNLDVIEQSDANINSNIINVVSNQGILHKES